MTEYTGSYGRQTRSALSRTRQWPKIDIMELFFAHNGQRKWNAWLTICLQHKDVQELQKGLYGIQVGMDDATKIMGEQERKKLELFFIRLQRSIEITAKKIFRLQYPSKLDDPGMAQQMQNNNPVEYNQYLKVKRQRDQAYQDFIRGVSF